MVGSRDRRKNDLKDGYGEYYFLSGEHYMGEFKADKMHGKGTQFFKNKAQFNGSSLLTPGHFRDGKRHGKGLYKDLNGNYFEEVWQLDELISKKEVSHAVNLEVESKFTQSLKESQEFEPLEEAAAGQEGVLPTSLSKLPDHGSEVIDFNDTSPPRPDTYRPSTMRNSRVGNETLSLQEFKENLGSFEGVFEDVLGTLSTNHKSSNGTQKRWPCSCSTRVSASTQTLSEKTRSRATTC